MSRLKKITQPKPQYLIDASGRKTHIILTLSEYDNLLHLLKERGISTDDSYENHENLPEKHFIKGKRAIDFYGIFKSDNPDFVRQIVEDREVYYDL